MPIITSLAMRDITDDEFHAIDKVVMPHAYAVQNQFGRLFDERVYENELASRLRSEGFEVHTQVPVQVVHGSFSKTYILDLVVNHLLYELKVVDALLAEHSAQGLHYAMLQNVRRVKLLNFGSPRVTGDLKWNTLSNDDRHHPVLCRAEWLPLSSNCERLVEQLKDFIRDWGTHLDCHLYSEALVHAFGGESACLRRLDVTSRSGKLGTHRLMLHDDDVAFVVTAFHRGQDAYRNQLQQLLRHLPLCGLQWINTNHSRIEITSLQRDD